MNETVVKIIFHTDSDGNGFLTRLANEYGYIMSKTVVRDAQLYCVTFSKLVSIDKIAKEEYSVYIDKIYDSLYKQNFIDQCDLVFEIVPKLHHDGSAVNRITVYETLEDGNMSTISVFTDYSRSIHSAYWFELFATWYNHNDDKLTYLDIGRAIYHNLRVLFGDQFKYITGNCNDFKDICYALGEFTISEFNRYFNGVPVDAVRVSESITTIDNILRSQVDLEAGGTSGIVVSKQSLRRCLAENHIQWDSSRLIDCTPALYPASRFCVEQYKQLLMVMILPFINPGMKLPFYNSDDNGNILTMQLFPGDKVTFTQIRY